MSILIKGLKIPKGKILTLQISPTGSVYVVDECIITAERYITTAIPILPHGRLIDENDVLKSAEELRQSPWYISNDFLHVVRKDGFETAIDLTVKDAPTIIDAEMEEDATEER